MLLTQAYSVTSKCYYKIMLVIALLAYQDTKHELSCKYWKAKAKKVLNALLGGLFYFEGQLEATYNSLECKACNSIIFDKIFPPENITRA